MIHLYQPAAALLFRTDLILETWADDCRFTEGPVYHPDGYYLFSDITANRIYRIDGPGRKTVFLERSGTDRPADPGLKSDQVGSNGLAIDDDGSLIVCRHGAHEVGRYRKGQWEPFAGIFEGRPFNSPNDLIRHTDGRVFFSDPPYGLKDGKLAPEQFQPRAGVYVWREGEVQLVSDRYQYPNGLCLSPDGKKLYIVSNKTFENFISIHDAYDYRFLAELPGENGDGVEVDPDGNLYLCSKEGIVVLDAGGRRLAKIGLPAIPANCCWGGNEGKDLLVTAREHVFRLPGLLV